MTMFPDHCYFCQSKLIDKYGLKQCDCSTKFRHTNNAIGTNYIIFVLKNIRIEYDFSEIYHQFYYGFIGDSPWIDQQSIKFDSIDELVSYSKGIEDSLLLL